MEPKKAKITCDISGIGGLKEPAIKVIFVGEHFSKRALLRLLKAIRAEYRRSVREYQTKKRIEQLTKAKEENDGLENGKASGRIEEGRATGNRRVGEYAEDAQGRKRTVAAGSTG